MSTIAKQPPAGSVLSGKYLTFRLQDESYGIDVLKVREIIRSANITVVPQMPEYIRGVINLRGKIIPVMDLRKRFEFTGVTESEHTCIVVAAVNLGEGKQTLMGMVVDAVEEVANISAAEIEATPDFGGQISQDYIIGIAKIKGAIKALLDIDTVVGCQSQQSLHNLADWSSRF